ncbi:DUF3303 family protein [Paraburkholderia sp. JHI2823]|uniref:DUF3303 domain-containing protein n=1 Tax=Paraburkholderia TaxID=1822464 RepID=UPI0004011B22|nr:DUF3303 family protein [Paraburkholderia mimosarum]
MKFIVQWQGQPAAQQAAIERFMQSGGRPPENVTLLGRWHAVGELKGVAIVEVNDTTALGELMLEWGDLFTMSATPAATDEELGAILAARQSQSK